MSIRDLGISVPTSRFPIARGPPVALTPKALREKVHCSTPLSQVSTTPSTPFSALADIRNDGKDELFGRVISGASTQEPETPVGRSTSELSSVFPEDGQKVIEESDVGRLLGYLSTEQPPQDATAAEYLVDNSGLQVKTVGLAFRGSKNYDDRDHSVTGPAWGSVVWGVDTGDGWLRVGERYLPMRLGNACVLIPATEVLLGPPEAIPDGPALTPDGRSVEFDGGQAIFFSHDKELAQGHEDKEKEKERIRMLRAAKLAHTACEAEVRIAAGEACSIDATGVLHGAVDAAPPLCIGQARLKRFRQKRRFRHPSTESKTEEASTLCVDANGRIFLYLFLDSRLGCNGRVRRKRAAQYTRVMDEILSVDGDGVIQG